MSRLHSLSNPSSLACRNARRREGLLLSHPISKTIQDKEMDGGNGKMWKRERPRALLSLSHDSVQPSHGHLSLKDTDGRNRRLDEARRARFLPSSPFLFPPSYTYQSEVEGRHRVVGHSVPFIHLMDWRATVRRENEESRLPRLSVPRILMNPKGADIKPRSE